MRHCVTYDKRILSIKCSLLTREFDLTSNCTNSRVQHFFRFPTQVAWLSALTAPPVLSNHNKVPVKSMWLFLSCTEPSNRWQKCAKDWRNYVVPCFSVLLWFRLWNVSFVCAQSMTVNFWTTMRHATWVSLSTTWSQCIALWHKAEMCWNTIPSKQWSQQNFSICHRKCTVLFVTRPSLFLDTHVLRCFLG